MLVLKGGGEADNEHGVGAGAWGGLQTGSTRSVHRFSTELASVFTCLFFLLPSFFHPGSVLLFPNSPSTLQETFY